MRVVLLLSWYDEAPEWLATVVAGFGRFCDDVVAVDGAYLFYPEARGRSHPEQAEAILSAAEAAGIGCTIHRPCDPFEGNEVEKRNLTLQLAGALAPDWLIVADGDYHVIQCDPDAVRGALENTDLNVASYLLADADAGGSFRNPTRDIYRWTRDLAYGPAHYTICGTYGGRRQWLRGPEIVMADAASAIEPCLELRDALVAVHRNRERADARREAARRYYRERDELGIEDIAAICWNDDGGRTG